MRLRESIKLENLITTKVVLNPGDLSEGNLATLKSPPKHQNPNKAPSKIDLQRFELPAHKKDPIIESTSSKT